MAPHAKAQEKPQAPNPLRPRVKLDTAEHTRHDEWAAHYIIPQTATRKNNTAKITVTRHPPQHHTGV